MEPETLNVYVVLVAAVPLGKLSFNQTPIASVAARSVPGTFLEEELKVPEFSNPEAAGAVILLEDVFASFLAISKSNSTEPEPAVSTPSDCSEITAESRSLLALLFLTKTFS